MEQRISKTAAGLMLIVAIFFDVLAILINFIPVAGQILGYLVTGIGYVFIWFWLSLKGVSLFSTQRLGQTLTRFFGPAAAEALTAGIAPGLTITVLISTSLARLTDTRAQKETEDEADVADIFSEQIGENNAYLNELPPQEEAYEDEEDRDTI